MIVNGARSIRVSHVVRIQTRPGSFRHIHPFIQARVRHQHVIGRGAHLPALEYPEIQETLNQALFQAVPGEDGGVLAPHLQSDRCQVFRRRLHDQPPNLGTAGINQVVPGKTAEMLRQFDASRHYGKQVFVKMRFYGFFHYLRRGRGMFGGLDYHPVAGGKHVVDHDQRAFDGEIPGRDIPYDAFGLAYHPGRGRTVHHGVQFTDSRLHPLFKLGLDITPAGDNSPAFKQVGDQGMVRIEIGSERLPHGFAKCNHHVVQRSQPLQPGIERRVSVRNKRLLLFCKYCVQFGIAGVGHFSVLNSVLH